MRFHSLLLFLSLVLYSVILLKITLSALFVSAAPEASNLTKRVGSFTPSCQLLALNHSLNTELHGQHIATERVFRHISAHLRDPHPQKPLALSFHGYTGVGKNFVSNLIAASLFGMGTKSNFFHFYDATIHFAHRSKIDEYKVCNHCLSCYSPVSSVYLIIFDSQYLSLSVRLETRILYATKFSFRDGSVLVSSTWPLLCLRIGTINSIRTKYFEMVSIVYLCLLTLLTTGFSLRQAIAISCLEIS